MRIEDAVGKVGGATPSNYLQAIDPRLPAALTANGNLPVAIAENTTGLTTATTLQNGASANGNGNPVTVDGLATVVFQVSISGTATVNFEASNDNWASITPLLATQVGASAIVAATTTSGYYRASIAGLKSIRARISGVTATPSITVVAYTTSVNAANKVLSLANAIALADGLALPTTPIIGAANQLYNGANLDVQRGNIEGIVLASATRTSSTNSADFTNHNARGVIAFLNVTGTSGTGGLLLRIQSKDPVSGAYYSMNGAPTPVTTVGAISYAVYPGIASPNMQGANYILPRTWRVSVTHNDSSNYTYSVGYCLIL